MDQELLGKLLIASPGLEDIRFQDSVILICEHSKEATMGLILNKPLYNFDTFQFLKKMKISSLTNFKPSPTFFGGPVHLNQGFIIHSNEKKYKNSEGVSQSDKKNFLHQRNRYGWWVIIVYIYGLLDAVVEAHLHPFNEVMNEDLEKPGQEDLKQK